MQIMSTDAQMIQSVGGITDENMGRQTNATSGKAILARQDQGALATSQFFDSLTYARRIHGEKLLSVIEQYMDQPKTMRMTDERGKPKYVSINDDTPELNDITLSRDDFVIDEADWGATARQSSAQLLVEMLTRSGPGGQQLLASVADLVIEMLDIPKGEEIVKRLRQMSGLPDPDADPDNPDPEQAAREQMAAEERQMMQRAQLAEIAKKEGDALRSMAMAGKAQADTAAVASTMTTAAVEQMRQAIEAAGITAGNPVLGRAADLVLAAAEARAQGMLTPQAPAPAGPPPDALAPPQDALPPPEEAPLPMPSMDPAAPV